MSKFDLSWVTTAVLLTCMASSCAQLDQEIQFIKTATVLAATGYPAVTRVGRNYILGRQSVLYLNDVISTDAVSSVSLQIDGGNQIQLEQSSSMLFSALNANSSPPSISFTLTQGSLTLHSDESIAWHYDIATSLALIETQSAQLWLGYSAKRDSIDIVSLGDKPVRIYNADGNVELTGPMEATTVIAGSAPQAIKTWSADEFRQASAARVQPGEVGYPR